MRASGQVGVHHSAEATKGLTCIEGGCLAGLLLLC